MNQRNMLPIAIALAFIALLMVLYPDVQSSTHLKQKWKAIPICKAANGTKVVPHHETEGNVSKHVNNCA